MKRSKLTVKLLENDFTKILSLFLIWRLTLCLLSLLAINFIPLAGRNFLGGGFASYIKDPIILSWANFDGEHYLSIASIGYKGLEQAFFPVYPLLMHFFSQSPGNLLVLTITGILISNIAFLLALYFLYKLVRIDFNEKISLLTIILLLVFPTSFYFAAVYNESLFLLIAVGTFYFARKGKWYLSGLLGMIASATRIFGLILFPALLIEAIQRKATLREYIWIFLAPVGFLAYLFYQWKTVGDPLAFYHLQKIVGEQHQSGLTLIPQVYFRYIKILLGFDISNPIYQTIFLEFVVGISFFALPIYGFFKKVRLSYLTFAFFSFLMPTIQGSFSSVPRYVIVFFPSFIALSIFLNSSSKFIRILLVVLLAIWLAVETVLYLRGYWVA
jgi:hypothetical protein